MTTPYECQLPIPYLYGQSPYSLLVAAPNLMLKRELPAIHRDSRASSACLTCRFSATVDMGYCRGAKIQLNPVPCSQPGSHCIGVFRCASRLCQGAMLWTGCVALCVFAAKQGGLRCLETSCPLPAYTQPYWRIRPVFPATFHSIVAFSPSHFLFWYFLPSTDAERLIIDSPSLNAILGQPHTRLLH